MQKSLESKRSTISKAIYWGLVAILGFIILMKISAFIYPMMQAAPPEVLVPDLRQDTIIFMIVKFILGIAPETLLLISVLIRSGAGLWIVILLTIPELGNVIVYNFTERFFVTSSVEQMFQQHIAIVPFVIAIGILIYLIKTQELRRP
ncbi:hypothetical protein [Pseudaestuariivita rosea]|uniref:hypothetical protein n=1 Tax=Pseudaestuariivita rosea TaxID=2763263 RepID=UPI001ABB7730|nr:hypothetical protein [Pseudaestuariivita rosea]